MNKKIVFAALILPLLFPLFPSASHAQSTSQSTTTQYNYTQDGVTSPLFGQTNFPTVIQPQTQVGAVAQTAQAVNGAASSTATSTDTATTSQPISTNSYSQNTANGQIFFDSIYMTTTNLSKGSVGDAVVALQTFLVDNGYLSIPMGTSKGYFGDLTKSALARFQQSIGVPAVGAFGPMTRAALRQAAAQKGISL